MPRIAMPSRRFFVSAAAVLVFSLAAVQACSPGWAPDVFVRKYTPDVPKDFYSGKLGVLESTYFRFNLIAAYRYLTGGKLGPNEVVPDHYWDYLYEDDPDSRTYAWNRTGEGEAGESDGTAQWLKVRNQLAGNKVDGITPDREIPAATSGFVDRFVNCTPSGFATAASTLEARASAWGKDSPFLVEWIKGQDAVFSNCDGKAVAAVEGVSPSAPVLLGQDRAYQVAAAAFYAMQFDTARAAFKAVNDDAQSPWHGIAAYLVARAMVRQAMLIKPSNTGTATFNADLLRQAQQQLEVLKKAPDVPPSAIADELNYVECRIDPDARIRAASLALAGPKPDPEFHQDLLDLVFLLDQRLDKDLDPNDAASASESNRGFAEGRALDGYKNAADLRAASPMVDWLITFQSRTEPAREHALEQWKSTHSLPWLIAAIAKAEQRDVDAPALIEAAAKVDEKSPAWQTVTYHRARLLAPAEPAGARKILDAALIAVRASGPASAINAFTGLRMKVATSYADFLTYVPRRDLLPSGQYAFDVPQCKSCDHTIAPMQFDDDSAGFFNRQASLALWKEAAGSSALPENMRRALVLAGWARSVVLNDADSARTFAAMLPADPKTGMTIPREPSFPAWLTLLRNPGLRFYLDDGLQRSQSAQLLDETRENWWPANFLQPGGAPAQTVAANFLTPSEINEAKQQLEKLMAVPSGTSWLGRRVIDYAKSNPRDEDVPEALHLVVRASRYGPSDSAISREAFLLLHRAYPESRWSKETPYHF